MNKSVYIFSTLLLSMLLFVNSCQKGADSIPELSAKIFSALQSGSTKKLAKTYPDVKEMQAAYAKYMFDTTHDKNVEKKLAVEKAVSTKLSLEQYFRLVIEQSKEKGIDLTTAKLTNWIYSVQDRKEGYKDSHIQLAVKGAEADTLVYYAVNLEGKWFLLDELRWKNPVKKKKQETY